MSARIRPWRWCAGLALCASAPAQNEELQQPPVLGYAGYDNEYHPQRTLVASFNLDTNPSGVTLWGNSVLTSSPSEVLSGVRSARLSGPTALLEIKPETLTLLAGEIYALEYDYRIVNDAGAVSVMTVLARWGAAGDLHTDPTGLDPEIYGNSGTQRRQFLFGAGGVPTFQLAPASGATVIVDNLRVWRIESKAKLSEPPIFSFGYPRLCDYNFDSPAAGALFNGVTAPGYEEVLGRFDLVNGVQIDNTLGDASWAERMRERNPAMVLLPYRLAYSAQHLEDNTPRGGTCGIQALFNRAIPPEWLMRGPGGEPLLDQFFEGNIQLDPTSYCPRIGGQVYPEFMEKFVSGTVLPSGLWDGIHFDQSEWFPNPLLAETMNGPLPPMDINRDGVTDSATFLFDTMRDTFESYFSLMHRRFGSSRVLLGNPGRIPLNPGILKRLNGWQQELSTGYEILANGDWNTTRSGHWHDFVRNYLNACAVTPGPQAIAIQCTGRGLGVENGSLTGHGYPNRVPNLEARDYRRMRLGLTTTLLGNGFFGYDLVDNTTPPVWFDEYAIDAQGRPTAQLSGKGYLGQPISAAQEITRPGPVVLDTGFEQGIPNGMWVGRAAGWPSQSGQIIDGATSLVVSSTLPTDFLVFETNPVIYVLQPGKTYDISAKVRVLEYHPESFSVFLAMGITADSQVLDNYGQSFVYHQDIDGPGQTITMRTQVKVDKIGASAHLYFGDRGQMAVDSVRLTEVRGGVFRRDFEGGIALVNPTPDAVTLTQAEVAGALGRTGIRRIAGVQDAAVNSGQAVTSGLTIPAGDGIVLLADRITAPVPTAINALSATPVGPDPGIDLSWNTQPSANRAGHLIQFKVAEGKDWDRFELAPPTNSFRLEFLDPGTAYDVRIATIDCAGRTSGFSPSARVTTPGSAPIRAKVTSIDPLVRGALVSVRGMALASSSQTFSGTLPVESGGTRVTINGVPCELSSVSPTSITFRVPDSVAFGTGMVRVFRGEISSAGALALVIDPDASACAADLNGDGKTDAMDFMFLATNFGVSVPVGTGGDLNGDGKVSSFDLNTLANDFGCGR